MLPVPMVFWHMVFGIHISDHAIASRLRVLAAPDWSTVLHVPIHDGSPSTSLLYGNDLDEL